MVPIFGVFDSYRDFVDFRGPNYKGDLVDIAVRNYQLARERKDPESALVAFERYGQTTRRATVSTLFAGMETLSSSSCSWARTASGGWCAHY